MKKDAELEKLIADSYLEGNSIKHIQKTYNVGCTKIYRILYDNNITMAKYKSISSRDIEIVELYKSGLSSVEIAKRFGMSNQGIINTVRRSSRGSVEIRRTGSRKRTYNVELTDAVISDYRAGNSLNELRHKYKLTYDALHYIIDSNNVERIGIKRRNKSSIDTVVFDRAVEMYEQGHGTTYIGKELNISYNTVRRELLRRGIKLRDIKNYIKTDPNKLSSVVEMYESGLGVPSISKKLGIGNTAVLSELKRKGIKMRPRKRRDD